MLTKRNKRYSRVSPYPRRDSQCHRSRRTQARRCGRIRKGTRPPPRSQPDDRAPRPRISRTRRRRRTPPRRRHFRLRSQNPLQQIDVLHRTDGQPPPHARLQNPLRKNYRQRRRSHRAPLALSEEPDPQARTPSLRRWRTLRPRNLLPLGRPVLRSALRALQNTSLFSTLERDYGVELGYSDEEVDATVADPRTAELLAVPKREPLLRIRQVIYSTKGNRHPLRPRPLPLRPPQPGHPSLPLIRTPKIAVAKEIGAQPITTRRSTYHLCRFFVTSLLRCVLSSASISSAPPTPHIIVARLKYSTFGLAGPSIL